MDEKPNHQSQTHKEYDKVIKTFLRMVDAQNRLIEDDTDTIGQLTRDLEVARYQIERAVGQLTINDETTPIFEFAGLVKSVVAQLRAYLDTTQEPKQ